MIVFLKRQPPVRIIAMGFALVILLGSGLLMLPCSLRDGATLHYIDALYTSTSAVCVTGLIAADAGDTFSLCRAAQADILLMEVSHLPAYTLENRLKLIECVRRALPNCKFVLLCAG